MTDDFINISLNRNTLDRYIVRTSILRAINEYLPRFRGRLLDVGCGQMPYKAHLLANSSVKEYIGIDLENAREYAPEVRPDYHWDGVILPFESSSFDCAIATEVLEHCPDPESVMLEVRRTLKPGGIIFFTVPFLWNLHEVPNDEYRFTPFSIKRHLTNAGFTNLEIKATGGWDASMAQMLGLWVRRSALSPKTRFLLSCFLLPAIRLLIRRDKSNSQVNFKEGQMVTGLYGIAAA